MGSEYGIRIRKYLLKQLGHCSFEGCKSKSNMEFAHLKETGLSGRGRGLNTRMKDVIMNPDKYALLCKEHHKLLDSKKL